MQFELFGIPLPLLVAIFLGASAIGSIVFVLILERRRRLILRRAMGERGLLSAEEGDTRSADRSGGVERAIEALVARLPHSVRTAPEALSQLLLHAGFEREYSAALFVIVRSVTMLVAPAVAFVFAPKDNVTQALLLVGIGFAAGYMGPRMVVQRIADGRRERIKRGIPDTLDLLVVCLEAGVALDAATQRVSRELGTVHSLLADELVGMSRRITAGVPREAAMQALYSRTGVEELRSLASNMVQSEKWGTSITTVLRVYAEQLRRQRRMDAEKRAATASTRMLLPLMLFIFPVIFVVLLGPAMMRIGDMFTRIGG